MQTIANGWMSDNKMFNHCIMRPLCRIYFLRIEIKTVDNALRTITRERPFSAQQDELNSDFQASTAIHPGNAHNVETFRMKTIWQQGATCQHR